MIIIMGIIIELTSILGSAIITYNSALDALVEIGRRGYKINNKAYEHLQDSKKKNPEPIKQVSIPERLWNSFLIVTPGINIIHSLILRRQMIKKNIR